MDKLLYLHPATSFTIVSIVATTAISIMLICTRKTIRIEWLKENHDLAAAIYNAFGLIYAVLVAFVVYASWNSYDTTKRNIEIEANKIAALYLDASAFDEPLKTNIRVAIANYTQAIIDEWPLLANGMKGTQKSSDAHWEIWNAYLNINTNMKNIYLYEESLRQLNTMTEYRRLRRFASKESTPEAIWIVLLVGGVISPLFTLFFGTKHIKTHCVMTAAYTVINAMVLYLIFIFSHPFTGSCAVSDAPFKSIQKMYEKQKGKQSQGLAATPDKSFIMLHK